MADVCAVFPNSIGPRLVQLIQSPPHLLANFAGIFTIAQTSVASMTKMANPDPLPRVVLPPDYLPPSVIN